MNKMISTVAFAVGLGLAVVPAGPAAPVPTPKDEITLKDLPSWQGGYRDDFKYRVDPYIAVAAKIQALNKQKAREVLLELADIMKQLERHEARLKADGLTGDRLELAVGRQAIKEEAQRNGLFVLCKMLFTAKPQGKFRRPSIGGPHFVSNTLYTDWPLEPIELMDGLPFVVVKGYTVGGYPEPVDEYLNYCLAECDWNTEKFKPKSAEEKQKALEKLLASPKLKNITDEDKKFLSAQIK